MRNEPIRLYEINTPELRGEERNEGLKSANRLRELIEGKEIYIETIKDKKGKYGRQLGKIWLKMDGKWVNINELMVKGGFAEYKEY